MADSRLSRLSAVNIMLSSVGTAPVNTLTNPGVDIAIAENILDEVDRNVQNEGWFFNTRKRILSPDSNGNINVPTNVLRLFSAKNTYYTVRSGIIYDFEEDTSVFTDSIEFTIVEMLEWNDLPEAAKSHITYRAARVYADRVLGDQTTSAVVRKDEEISRAALRKEHVRTARVDILSRDLRAILNRGNPVREFGSF